MTPSRFEDFSGVHIHKEAFCLMKYQAEDESEVEWIWNSRDGVTPFCVLSRTGKMMRHVQWAYDRYLPHYRPVRGERFFVDFTQEMAEPQAREYVERYWDHEEYPMREGYPDKNAAAAALLSDWLRVPGSPAVREATGTV